MKIRIKGNSIRYRLTRSEVAEFCEKGFFEDRTVFDNASFVYGLRVDENSEQLFAEFEANTITLKVPTSLASDWNDNAQVGFENTLSLKDGGTLHLLLEKDFACMDDRGEDESDNYPNPKLAQ